MLAPVTLGEQWRKIAGRLPADGGSARVTLRLARDDRADEAALILGPLTPGRTRSVFRLNVRPGVNPDRFFGRLDEAGIRGRLDLVEAEAAPEPSARAMRASVERARPFVEQWDALAASLPPDWSDIYAEVEERCSSLRSILRTTEATRRCGFAARGSPATARPRR
jgi:hypothetical protein